MTAALWYLGRGSGTMSLILLTIVVILGIGGRSGRAVFGLPRFGVTMVHRNASLLAVVFLAIHVTTLLFDPYAQLRLIDLVIPFTSSYRPLWLGLGAAAFDLIIALVVTSLLRHRIGVKAWRGIHWLAYVSWPIAFGHALGSGSDARSAWLLIVAGACAAGALAAVLWRISTKFTEYRRLERVQ